MLTAEQKLERLDEALRDGGFAAYTRDDVIAACKAGEMQWWENGDGNIITSVNTMPQGRVFTGLFIWGDLNDVMALQPQLEDFARSQGCRYWVGEGRRGWAKVLPEYGWKITGVKFYLDLYRDQPERIDG